MDFKCNLYRCSEAARRAAIHDPVMAMTDGYDTKVGERGLKLSGGRAALTPALPGVTRLLP